MIFHHHVLGEKPPMVANLENWPRNFEEWNFNNHAPGDGLPMVANFGSWQHFSSKDKPYDRMLSKENEVWSHTLND